MCGIGAAFETFSIVVRASRVPFIFRDLLAQAKGHEIFLQSIHGLSSHVAFATQQDHHHHLLVSPHTTVQPPHLQAPSLTQHGTFLLLVFVVEVVAPLGVVVVFDHLTINFVVSMPITQIHVLKLHLLLMHLFRATLILLVLFMRNVM